MRPADISRPLTLTLALLVAAPAAGLAQDRPRPYPVVPPPEYRQAVEAGTRSADGSPGPAYWQQWTDYAIRARLDPVAKRLKGSAELLYHNRSPDTLGVLQLHLHQNLHAEGAVRNERQEVTGGVELSRVAVDGAELEGGAEHGPTYRVDDTILTLRPPRPVAPGESVRIRVDYGFRVPQSGAGRMGWNADDLFYLGYWYPQMAVYDDVEGWHTAPYLGRGEFYMGYGSYDVELTLPEGWVVRATGTLENASDVLPADVRERLARAGRSDEVVHVLEEGDFGAGSATVDARDDRLTWRFRADSVRDFAFSATRRSLWDAARTPVGDRDGDGSEDYARVDALYRPEAGRWTETWRYAQHSIDFLSRYTGFPYPWPHMTALEGGGIIGGGMEYPMMTIMGDYEARGDSALYYVTAHELAHMWVPMVVGTDEKRYAWMDEGTTTFHENQAREEFFPGRDHDLGDREDYTRIAPTGDEEPMMRWMDYQYPRAGNAPNYDKPATVLVALREVLGEETFLEGLRTFVAEWAYRHPAPWDFFRTFDRVAGRDLGWFWRSWYYETWDLDQAVAGVRREGDRWIVTVEDQGWVPMPVPLSITLEDGSTISRRISVEPWLGGNTEVDVAIDASAPITRVEIDPEGVLPDVDRADNVWTRDGGADSSGRREE